MWCMANQMIFFILIDQNLNVKAKVWPPEHCCPARWNTKEIQKLVFKMQNLLFLQSLKNPGIPSKRNPHVEVATLSSDIYAPIPHFKAGIFIHFSSYSKLQLLLCLVKCLPLSTQEVTASQWCSSAPVHNLLTGSLSLQSIWDFSVHKPFHSGMVVHSLEFPVCL